ncbi:MAG TPA: family 1 glycosylhydrolase [Anaerolineaceae bacterium]|nr:family 1 glycosylhydrolase [Anaerolineaceae bacterium]
MPEATFHFPAGFLWGTATAAHQVEGNNLNNNWSAWEAEPGRIIFGQKSGLACDWWGGRWKEDLDRAAEAGQNAHRLSVEWSRIQPRPNRWDENALDYYRQMVRGAVERGLTPMVTLHHFTDPLWITEKGGWENEETIQAFSTFSRKVVDALKEYVTLWVTINEPNVYAYSGYLEGVFPPGKHDFNTTLRVYTNLVKGHAAAYQAIHGAQPQARVGIAAHYRGFVPARSWFPGDAAAANIQHTLFNQFFPRSLMDGTLNFLTRREKLPQAARTQDFLGINYYTRDRVKFNLFAAGKGFGRNEYASDAELSGTGYLANEPLGMFDVLKWGLQFQVPMIVTENGVEDADDRMRPRYLVQHLHQVWRAVNFNWPVRGYFHWSLLDNFEWERGWTQRFGLWGLEPETQLRRKRSSADLYAEICRENGISSDTVRRFTPELMPMLFPG